MINILKALADHTRLRILTLLNFGELTVQELTQVLNMGQSTVSHHLKILLETRILQVRRQGTWGYYKLNFENKFFSDIFPCIQRHFEGSPQYAADSVRVFDLFEKRRKSNRYFFDLKASQWDSVARNLLPLPDYFEILSDMMPLASLGVEVGCGTGNLLGLLHQKTRFLIGVDQSSEMLEEARKRLLENDQQDIDLRLGDMMHLPLETAQVDVVVMNMALHHAVQPLHTLKEISRVLKNGGFFLLADMLPHGNDWVREKLADHWLGFSRPDLEEWLSVVDISIQSWQEIKGEGEQLGVFIVKGQKTKNITENGNMSLFKEY